MERSSGPRAMPMPRRSQFAVPGTRTNDNHVADEAQRTHLRQDVSHHGAYSSHNLSSTQARAHPSNPSNNTAHGGVRDRPSLGYIESGTRWMEKQEVRSLREALNDMDIAEEKRVHRAAQDEASALVYKHQNPNATYHNPDLKKDYRSHLRQGSYTQAFADGAIHAYGSRSSSGSSNHDEPAESKVRLAKRKSKDVLRKITPPSLRSRQASGSSKNYGELADMVRKDINATRRISSGSRRTLSGSKRGFMHPNDKIWEDEQTIQTQAAKQIPELKPTIPSAVPSYTRKNPFARVRLHHDKVERSNSAPLLNQPAKIDRAPPAASPTGSLSEDLLPTFAALGLGRERSSLEIRSDEIRAATSKRRSDRSPNLPQPTIVSDRNDRPIVSFNSERRMHQVKADEVSDSRPGSSGSTIVRTARTPPIPILNLPDDDTSTTSRNADPSIPMICLPDEEPPARSSYAVPQIAVEPPSSQQPARPLPSLSGFAKPKSTPHYSPSVRQSGILCAHCALPIAGRVLSAAGQRFHPGCFVCHQCNTNLELVAFYPEPESKRQERIARIHARQFEQYDYMAAGESEATALQREADDGDESLRFYCHLDFHELYSPRCKSCKTPIEGEVIIACGAQWHAGHFFCAQCGDPFDSTTPFVEKEGYAWCVGCHTNRYSSKCRKCKKPVTDLVVKALGADWHSQCFCCMECNSPFDDGRYFLRGESQEPVCIRCEERRLKA